MSSLPRGRRSRTGGVETDAPEQRRSLFERVIFSFMGPPQLGDQSTPIRPPAQVATCPRCGRPWAEHEVVRLPTHSYTRCPGS